MKAVFVTREFGKSGAELTKDEFIQMLMEDFSVARVAYRKYSDIKAEETYQKDCENHKKRREQRIQRIIDDSFKKYKREPYRLRWVDSEMKKVPSEVLERQPYAHFGHDLDSIKWDIKPWENGCRIFNVVIDLEKRLGNLYDEAIQNKYFRNCTGWSIVEDFSTEMKLHLSEKMQEEWRADEKRLADDIARFYADCRYCGD
jgi:hypothetical protein